MVSVKNEWGKLREVFVGTVHTTIKCAQKGFIRGN